MFSYDVSKIRKQNNKLKSVLKECRCNHNKGIERQD